MKHMQLAEDADSGGVVQGSPIRKLKTPRTSATIFALLLVFDESRNSVRSVKRGSGVRANEYDDVGQLVGNRATAQSKEGGVIVEWVEIAQAIHSKENTSYLAKPVYRLESPVQVLPNSRRD